MPQPQHAAVRNRLLRAMSADDFAWLQPHLEPVELSLEQRLIEANAPVEHFYFLESGISSITAYGSNGRVEVGIVGCEGLVSSVPLLLGSNRVPHEHFIQLAGEGLCIPVGVLCAAFEESPSLRRLLLRYVQTEVVQVRQTAYVNASFNIEARLARWLLMCHDRVEGDDLPLKHEFLSMMLGVQRSGVTLALQNLEGGRCIRGRRGRITVIDRALLDTIADGSYGAPEAEYTRLIGGA